MRIPSPLNEPNLYRRQPRADERNAAIRKLLRLGIAMALLIVVMRQAGRRELYEPFFREDSYGADRGVARNDPALQPYEGNGDSGRSTTAPSAVTRTAESADVVKGRLAGTPSERSEPNESAQRIVEAIPVPEQRWWLAALWRRLDRGESIALGPTLRLDAAAVERVLSVAGFAPESQQGNEPQPPHDPQQDWSASLQRLLNHGPFSTEDRARWLALIKALDEAAMDRTVDGATWRSSDFDAFYWSLAQATSSDFAVNLAGFAGRAQILGVLPLLQQPSIYRGQTVRLSGRVARAESLAAAENAFGLQQYWQLWLHPDDGSDQPVLLITPSVPARVASVAGDQTSSDGPKIRFVGRYLKRFAYRSAAGVEIAPALAGRILGGEATGASGPADDGNSPGALSRRLISTLIIATAVGIVLAVLAMWRTAVESKRIRRLRHASQAKSGFDPEKLGALSSLASVRPPENAGDQTADSKEI